MSSNGFYFLRKNCTGVAPDTHKAETKSFHRHVDLLGCEYCVAYVLRPFVVKYQLPFFSQLLFIV
jgi:hypothetical protein